MAEYTIAWPILEFIVCIFIVCIISPYINQIYDLGVEYIYFKTYLVADLTIGSL